MGVDGDMRSCHDERYGLLADNHTRLDIVGIIDLSWNLANYGHWQKGEFNVVCNLVNDVIIDKFGTSLVHDSLPAASEVRDGNAKRLGPVWIRGTTRK